MTSPELTQAEAVKIKPWVQLRMRGYQSGAGSVPGRMLFNLDWISAGVSECVGSTVTIETMLERGYRVEVVA